MERFVLFFYPKVEQMDELLTGKIRQRFFMDYEYPSYAINEVPKYAVTRLVSRREIGHSTCLSKQETVK